MSISSNLKAIRSKRGMTQGHLADKAGIELTQVSRIERGASEPKLETIKKLSIALSCSTDELIMDGEANTPEYIKRTVERIKELTPLKRYAVLDLINSYCIQNKIPEPSLNEFRSQDEVDYKLNENYKDALREELKLVEELANDAQIEMEQM
jgi:transcriptional regulator with XRE-family HTH domain